MIIAIDAWSQDLLVCDVTRFFGGAGEVANGIDYKELRSFMFKKGAPNKIQVFTQLRGKKNLLLTKDAHLLVSAGERQIDFNDPEEDIFGTLDLYEENKYFGKIIVHADFTYNLYCIRKDLQF